MYGINDRMGKLKEIDKFDGSVFGILPLIGHSIDPQARILLETTYEAICDAGIKLIVITKQQFLEKVLFLGRDSERK